MKQSHKVNILEVSFPNAVLVTLLELPEHHSQGNKPQWCDLFTVLIKSLLPVKMLGQFEFVLTFPDEGFLMIPVVEYPEIEA